MAEESGSWFSEEAAAGDAGAKDEGAASPPVDTKPEGDAAATAPAQDLTGKPEAFPEAFWVAPKEGETADWQSMAMKVAAALGEGRKKISEQGEALAKHTVPDSVAPYWEGLDKDALLKASPRAGLDAAQLEQIAAQMRAAGAGPGAFQAFIQSHLKARHEAAPEEKTGEQRRDAAVAELNAAGRPGSQMAQRVRTWGAGLLREGRLSEKQAKAVEALTHSSDGLEALHAIMGQTPSPAAGNGTTHANQSILDDLAKRMQDQRFGTDAQYTAEVEAMMKRHESLINAKHGGPLTA